jgi:hypothetical protein
MDKFMPKLGLGATRAVMFSLPFMLALLMPVLGVALPLTLGLLEWGHRGGIRGEQRTKFYYLLAGGLSGMALHFALQVFATQPELLSFLM